MYGRLLILFCLIATTGAAQERLSLQDAISKALQHNFDIRIAQVNAEQAAVNNTTGNAGLLPNINGSAGINTGSTNTHQEFADGRIQERNGAGSLGYNAGVTADYTIFAAGRGWLVKKQLNASQQLAGAQLKEQMQLMVSQTIQAYAAAVWRQQQMVAIDTGIVLAKTRMILSQLKYETGASAKVDYLQAKVDFNTRRGDSLSQLALIEGSFADLNLLMGEEAWKTYVVDDSLDLNLVLSPTDKERLIDLNLTLDVARRNVDIANLNTRIAGTYLWPTVGATAGYTYGYSKSQTGLLLFSRSYGPAAGLSLNVPIFQGGNLRRQVKVASLQAFREELLYERQNTETGRQYRRAWKDYETSVSAYRLEQANILDARENADIQKARFRVGIATTVEVKEAEVSYVESLTRLFTAAYNVKVNETRVLELESALVK
jgi:outer membrane protein